MAEHWWRSWHGAPTDPKWRLIAKRAGCRTADVVAVAWAILDHASQQAHRGDVATFDAEVIADFLDMEPDAVMAIVAAMEGRGVICDGRLAAWETRQPKREDGTAADRKRAQRDREKAQRDQGVSDVTTEGVTQCHAASRNVTTEERRGEEIREEISADADIPAPRKRGAAKPPSDADPAFSAFWSAYPRKVAKGAARRAWVTALRKSDAATITAAAKRVEDRGEFTPHPASWLNAERWGDATPAPPSKPSDAPSSAPKAFAEAVRAGRDYLIRFHERNDAVVRAAIRDHGLTLEELRRVGVSPPAGSFPMRVA